MRAGSGGMVNSNVLHSTQILKPEADLELVLHLFSPALVAGVLGSSELRALWEDELGQMRNRIHALRAGLVSKLAELGAPEFAFIQQQAGMFSYSGLSREQVDRLRDEFGIYAVGTGRICVAALSQNNLDYVARAVYAVSRG